jgi:four helix bundle protein
LAYDFRFVVPEALMRDFRGLEVWQRADQITSALYSITAKFPREELYGFTSQIRRCSASMGANLAEGCGRQGEGEFHRFVQPASGPASELDYHLILARDLNLMAASDYDHIAGDLGCLRRKLSALISTVRFSENSQWPKAKGQWPTASCHANQR